MEVLPEDVMIDILSRLPVKTIIHCKCVCKKWRNLVLMSSFVNLHLSRSPTGLIVHHNPVITTEDEWYDSKSNDPGILKWVEIEDKVDYHHLHPTMTLDLNLVSVLQNTGTKIMGSVNGLICLWQNYPIDNIYICNPITREFMLLPEQRYYGENNVMIWYGFGVNSQTGEYKVVRTIQHILTTGHLSTRPSVLEAEVYTLGTSQWRSVGCVPYGLTTGLNGFYGSIFLNDHCHWIVCYPDDTSEKLCTFDLNKETFQLFPSPPPEAIQVSRFHHQSLAVLKGCLCKLDTFDSRFTIWVMKEYGIKKSWHKEAVIKQSIGLGFDWPFWEDLSLIEGLKDGSILMLYGDYELWVYNPRTKTIEYDEMFGHYMTGLTYHPSFLKLKNYESD